MTSTLHGVILINTYHPCLPQSHLMRLDTLSPSTHSQLTRPMFLHLKLGLEVPPLSMYLCPSPHPFLAVIALFLALQISFNLARPPTITCVVYILLRVVSILLATTTLFTYLICSRPVVLCINPANYLIVYASLFQSRSQPCYTPIISPIM